MKYILIAIAFFGALPLSAWLRGDPKLLPKIWVVVGFLGFAITAIPHGNMAIISWAGWPGYAKGLEISLLDMLMLILYATVPKFQGHIPFRTPMAIYFAAVIISVFFASVPFASLFYVWQLVRMFFVYLVVARACQDERVVSSLLTGLTCGLVLEAGVVVWQRFVLGLLQTPGTMGHQNGLGMISYFAVFPLFSLFLAGLKGWQPLLGPMAGSIVAVLTVSRGTLALTTVGFGTLFLLSVVRSFTPRKMKIATVGLALSVAAAPFVISSFEKRFNRDQSFSSYDERAAFENAAKAILSDYPMGVGANNFVVIANERGYYERAGVTPTFESRGGHVHNAFLLAAAETGYLGVCALILMMAPPMFLAFRVGWRHRKDKRGDLLLGLGVSFVAVYVQSLFEWAFFTYWFQYLFAISIGLTAGLAQQLTVNGLTELERPGIGVK